MKIYSSFRQGQTSERTGWGAVFQRSLGAFRRRRRVGSGAVFKKVKISFLCLLVGTGLFVAFNLEKFSFAYNPPLNSRYLVRPGVLASFQSVPLTDPDEYEPDSMDRIEEVVEEVKPAATALTRNELRYAKYKLRRGDSLWEIARKNGIRSGTLLWSNSGVIPDASRLPVGKEIVIPNLDVIEIKLKAGETIWTLAQRYSVNAPDVIKFNRLTDAKTLKAGDKLYIPNPNLAFQSVQKILAARTGGGFLWPSSTRMVNSEFGFRMHPIRKRRIFHEGIDIGGGRGSTVFSSADGSISFVGWMRGYGKIIVIRHNNGLTTRYAHLSATRVSRGQRVEQGQMIGTVGATGLATGPNLHFEVRKNGLPQDPLTYLRRR